MLTTRDLHCLLQVDPTKRMSLTSGLHYTWLDSSTPSGTTQSSTMTGTAINPGLSDFSELSEFPEDNQIIGAKGGASILSEAPSSDDMLGVDSLSSTRRQSSCPASTRAILKCPHARSQSQSSGHLRLTQRRDAAGKPR
jgi:hypothetical protein